MSFTSNALQFKLFHNRYIHRPVPEITVIGYAQNQTIGKQNKLSLWEEGYQCPLKIDISFHKLHKLGTLYFKHKYNLYLICNINVRISILLNACILHITNHIW
jgi:hypothetical protein